MRQPRIVIVDPAGPSGLAYSKLVARLQPLEVRHTTSVADDTDIAQDDGFDLAILVIRSGSSGINTLDQLVETDPDLPIVVIGNEEEGQETLIIRRFLILLANQVLILRQEFSRQVRLII